MTDTPNTPRHGHPPIQMREVADVKHLRNRGDFFWSISNGRRHLVVAIPFRDKWIFSRWSIGQPYPNGGCWQWNGNAERPTLDPELHATGIWRGRVTDGFLVEG